MIILEVLVSPTKMNTWKIKNQIINTAVRNGGTVFGGAVRDKYLHDSHAIKFYDAHKDTKMYNDYNYMPHLFGRWTVPNDIDISVDECDFNELKESLEKHFNMKLLHIEDITETKYFNNQNLESGQIMHYKYSVFPKNIAYDIMEMKDGVYGHLYKEFLKTIDKFNQTIKPVNVDILVNISDYKLSPPFGELDFLCNGLILNKDGFALSNICRFLCDSPIRMNKLFNMITDQIERKEAVVYKNTENFRLKKMIKKGWTISYDNNYSFNEIKKVTCEDDDTCSICLGDFPYGADKYKLSCSCKTFYHIDCLKKVAEIGPASINETHKCIVCKYPIYDIKQDINMVRDIHRLSLHGPWPEH